MCDVWQASELQKRENRNKELSRQVETLQRNLMVVMDRELALHKKYGPTFI